MENKRLEELNAITISDTKDFTIAEVEYLCEKYRLFAVLQDGKLKGFRHERK